MEVSAGGPVFHRERVGAPGGRAGFVAGLVASGALVAIGVVVLSRGGVPAATGGVVLALLGSALGVTAWSFRALSIVVDREGIAWAFGPFSRRYAHTELVMFRARDFAYRRAGGWGIGRAHDGLETYQVWGGSGEVLDLVVKRAGVTRHYLVSTALPELVCAALVRAGAPRA